MKLFSIYQPCYEECPKGGGHRPEISLQFFCNPDRGFHSVVFSKLSQ